MKSISLLGLLLAAHLTQADDGLVHHCFKAGELLGYSYEDTDTTYADSPSFTAWQTTSTWVAESLTAATEARKTWLELQSGSQYNDSSCPYPGDAIFSAAAVPILSTNPTSYSRYIFGNPEMFLGIDFKSVYYPISCSNGATGFIEMNYRNKSWMGAAFHPPTARSYFYLNIT